jgi:hypothetical protein
MGDTEFENAGPYIEHAERCWEAERENAERLTGDTRMVVSLLTAVIALTAAGIFRSDLPALLAGVSPDARTAFRWIFGLLACAAFLSFALSLWQVFRRLKFTAPESEAASDSEPGVEDDRSDETQSAAPSGMVAVRRPEDEQATASACLLYDEETLAAILEQTSGNARATFSALYKAALVLADKNFGRRLSVQAATRSLQVGVLVVGISLLAYTALQMWPTKPQEISNGRATLNCEPSGSRGSGSDSPVSKDTTDRTGVIEALEPPRDGASQAITENSAAQEIKVEESDPRINPAHVDPK